jgi:hypothetical protein
MSDSHQAIYDAVRSRISNGDIGQAVESAARTAFGNAEHLMQCVAAEFTHAAMEQQRPFAVMRPRMYPDGNQWCALYGDDLQSGVCAFGNTPDAASRAFDLEWEKAKAGESNE